jgi:bacterioferritin-associated ferredoxin
MIVCLCEGLSEREIESAVRQGATTVRAVAKCTGAGTSCGSCAGDVRRIVSRLRESVATTADRAVAAK